MRLTGPTSRYVPKAEKAEAQTNVHARVLIAALFTAAQSLGNNPNCPSTIDIIQIWSSHTLQYYLAIKKGWGTLAKALQGENLQNILQVKEAIHKATQSMNPFT